MSSNPTHPHQQRQRINTAEPSHPAAPQTPRVLRGLRKIQSFQVLTSKRSNAESQAQNRAVPQLPDEHSRSEQAGSPSTRRRARSSSATGLHDGLAAKSQKRPPRRSGFGLRRSVLENLLRDGPQNGDLVGGLQELRYLVLSTRVDADADGMSPYRIYLWLVLLDIPPLPTDEYLSLIHRGRSPAYTKIRNDTFRTLATDPLFKRRVTEASLIRLLNAVAWRIHDAKNPKPPKRQTRSLSQKRAMELLINAPPDIVEEKEGEDDVLGPVTVHAPATDTTPAPAPPGSSSSFSSSSTTTAAPSLADSATYVQGMNVLCAPFLYAARSEVEAFALFHHFITRECPGYIRGAMDGVHKGLALVDRCLAVVDPKLASYLFSKGMQAELYAFPSVLTLCACTPPLPEVLHLWDFLFAYGPHLNILCIVAQLIRMRDTILKSPSPNKILRLFPPLDAKLVITLTVSIVRMVPDGLYSELIDHAK